MRYHRRFKKTNAPVILPATKRAAPCVGCGEMIPAGARSVWYPLANAIQCPKCFAARTGTPLWGTAPATWTPIADGTDDYSGSGLDARIEDDMAARCGLL